MIGSRFGRLVVVGDAPRRRFPSGQIKKQWHCRCDCGVEKTILEQTLTRGQSTSCGCYQRENVSLQMKKHGHTANRSKTYRSWEAMKRRVNVATDRDYPSYGGRGIIYCERWEQFENFLADMGECPPKLTLDRVDVNGNYEPDNCCWTTRRHQAQNRRPSSEWVYTKPKGRPPGGGGVIHNRKLTEEDVRLIRASEKSQVELAKEYGVTKSAICGIRKRRTWKHVA